MLTNRRAPSWVVDLSVRVSLERNYTGVMEPAVMLPKALE